MAETHAPLKPINAVVKKPSPPTNLISNWGDAHSCFVQLSHRREIADDVICTRVLAIFPDLFRGGRSPHERKRAVEERVAIWCSGWADEKAGMENVGKV